MSKYKTIGDRQYTKEGDQLIERAYPGKGDKDNRTDKKKFREGHHAIFGSKCVRCRKREVSDVDMYCDSCLRDTISEHYSLEEECHKIISVKDYVFCHLGNKRTVIRP